MARSWFYTLLAVGLGIQSVVDALSITSDSSGVVNKTFDFVVVGGGTAGMLHPQTVYQSF
jgi:hypothetical protein